MSDDSDIEQKLRAVKELTQIFKLERMVHLGVTSVALVMLLASAGALISSSRAGLVELSGLFGSSGLITYSAGRLLTMWNQALRLLGSEPLEKTP